MQILKGILKANNLNFMFLIGYMKIQVIALSIKHTNLKTPLIRGIILLYCSYFFQQI